MIRLCLIAAVLLWLVGAPRAAEDRDARVRNDLKEVESTGGWFYNDLPKGLAEAARTGKPLLVVFRCIP